MIDQPSPIVTSAQPAGAVVLVSDASFAGLATAYWMNRLGYRVTVIEAASGLRTGGTWKTACKTFQILGVNSVQ